MPRPGRISKQSLPPTPTSPYSPTRGARSRAPAIQSADYTLEDILNRLRREASKFPELQDCKKLAKKTIENFEKLSFKDSRNIVRDIEIAINPDERYPLFSKAKKCDQDDMVLAYSKRNILDYLKSTVDDPGHRKERDPEVKEAYRTAWEEIRNAAWRT